MARKSTNPKELKDAFKRAAEIASVVPEPMQEAAFHRALDQILGGEEPAPPPRNQRRAEDATGRRAAADHAQELVHGINRTAHPEIASASKVLDRALAVLRLAAHEFDLDGLTAPEIAMVLTEKFRLRTSRQAVTQALGAARTMVDTGKRGQTTVYRIMQAGEDYLEREGNEERASKRTPRRRRKAGRQREASIKAPSEESSPTPTRRRRGPKAALADLIDSGFFSEARTINDAQQQLRHKKGLKFSLQELSPSFVRLLREGRLDRDRNESGQYEYRST
jgi:hypothetical protein